MRPYRNRIKDYACNSKLVHCASWTCDVLNKYHETLVNLWYIKTKNPRWHRTSIVHRVIIMKLWCIEQVWCIGSLSWTCDVWTSIMDQVTIMNYCCIEPQDDTEQVSWIGSLITRHLNVGSFDAYMYERNFNIIIENHNYLCLNKSSNVFVSYYLEEIKYEK